MPCERNILCLNPPVESEGDINCRVVTDITGKHTSGTSIQRPDFYWIPGVERGVCVRGYNSSELNWGLGDGRVFGIAGLPAHSITRVTMSCPPVWMSEQTVSWMPSPQKVRFDRYCA